MVKKIFKLFIFLLFIFSGAFLWMGRKSSRLCLKWEDLDSKLPHFGSQPGVLIIFNSGGWGNTPFELAEDFFKVLRGIKDILNRLGWKTTIISYGRTGNDFLGRIRGLEEILTSFDSQSKKLASRIKTFLEQNPRGKVLMAGLSMGAGFTGETMRIIGETSRVFAIKAGAPFWADNSKLKNVLELINEKDFLAMGNYRIFFGILIRGLTRWAAAKIRNRKFPFSEVIHVSGHRYDWRSFRIRKKIISFLENNFKFEQSPNI